MYFDDRFARPSDNPLRVLAYTATIGAGFTAAVLLYNCAVVAGDYRGPTGRGGGSPAAGFGSSDVASRLTTSTTRDSCMFGGCADQVVIGTRGDTSVSSGGGVSVNSAGRLSGPV